MVTTEAAAASSGPDSVAQADQATKGPETNGAHENGKDSVPKVVNEEEGEEDSGDEEEAAGPGGDGASSAAKKSACSLQLCTLWHLCRPYEDAQAGTARQGLGTRTPCARAYHPEPAINLRAPNGSVPTPARALCLPLQRRRKRRRSPRAQAQRQQRARPRARAQAPRQALAPQASATPGCSLASSSHRQSLLASPSDYCSRTRSTQRARCSPTRTTTGGERRPPRSESSTGCSMRT